MTTDRRADGKKRRDYKKDEKFFPPITLGFQWAVRQSAEVENQMTSVERVMEYTSLDQEPPKEVEDRKPPEDWPSAGRVEFEKVSFGYSPETPVLKNLNFVIEGTEKIGVVGRTGAGKSSIIQCKSGRVFRCVLASL